jgi:hypothetical protein
MRCQMREDCWGLLPVVLGFSKLCKQGVLSAAGALWVHMRTQASGIQVARMRRCVHAEWVAIGWKRWFLGLDRGPAVKVLQVQGCSKT